MAKVKNVEEDIIALIESGASVAEIEESLGVSRKKIKEVKSRWFVVNNKRISDRSKAYAEDRAARFRHAKRERREGKSVEAPKPVKKTKKGKKR